MLDGQPALPVGLFCDHRHPVAALPVVLSSMIVMLQPRIGGPATAAVIANGALPLIGFGLALALVHLTAAPLGAAWSLTLALAVSMLWNLALLRLAPKR